MINILKDLRCKDTIFLLNKRGHFKKITKKIKTDKQMIVSTKK